MTELFSAILKASFQGSIVILAVIALRFLLKKAPKSLFCLLWLLVGLRLVMLFEIPSPLSLQPRLEDTNLSIQAQQPVQVPDIVIQNPAGQPLATLADPVVSPEVPEENWENLQTDSYPYWVEDGVITGPVDLGNIAAWIWLLGTATMLTASLVSYIKLKRRVREAYWIENGCFECPGLDTAFVLGFLPPRIYLPLGLSDQEKKFIFDHENTHIARHDHWFKVLGYVVLSIHWFNPLVWLGYGLLCRDMELACDEHVVKYMTLPERKAYSAALLSCGGKTARISACPVAFGESNPKKRILNVLNYKRPSFWIILLAVAAILFVSVCLLTSPEKQVEEPEEETKWNLEMEVSNVSPSGVTVNFIQNGPFAGYDRAELQFGSDYSLEKWTGDNWEPVEMLPQEYDVAWTTEAYIINRNGTTAQHIDWAWLYGELPPGRYMIGKPVDLFRTAGENEIQMFWAEFTIEETETTAWSTDMTDEEYLTLCRNAVAELQSREQYHISETLAYFTGETEDSRSNVVFWRDGDNWLRQSYVTRMRENRNLLYYDGKLYMQWQQEGQEAEWDLVSEQNLESQGYPWLGLVQWDSQNVTFEGTALESEELKVSVIVHAAPPTLGWDDVQEYNILFFFDKAGNMTRAIMSAVKDSTKVIDDLTIETTLASNIQIKLETVAAQRPDAPELSQTLTEEQWLEKCRTALESYQTQESRVILVENSFSGEGVLTENNAQLWYIDGEDWARMSVISNSDFLQENWHLCKEGHCYSKDSCTIHYPGNGEGYCNGWQDCEDISHWPLPWPLEFDWDHAEITNVEARTDGQDTVVYLGITGSPYPGEYGYQAENYIVTLWLRPSGELWQVRLEYTETSHTGDKTNVCSTISLNAASPEEAEQMIHQCHNEALLHAQGICDNPKCTDSTHDHSGVSCTDTNCTNATHHHSNHHNDDHHH